MKRRLISLVLILTMLIGLQAPMRARAPNQLVQIQSGTEYNPLYADILAPEMAQQASGTLQSARRVLAEDTEAEYVSPDEAADQLREAMIHRASSVTLYIEVSDSFVENQGSSWFKTYVFPLAISMALAKTPYDGDYLKWSWKTYSWTAYNNGEGLYAYTLTIQYYTSAEEEEALFEAVDALAASLGLSDLSAYDAYTVIYDYITTHVSYDSETLSKFSSGEAEADDYKIFTAYGALFNEKAVCQGYAALYYALCQQASLPVRIITSTSHAWNIVYLKEIWYPVDSTWDSDTSSHRRWYLRGTTGFSHSYHTMEEEYLTEEFQAGYPISPYDYDPDLIYNDVPKTNVHYEAIRRATELNLFNGTGTYTFDPELEVSRAMVVTVLWRLEGSPEMGSSGFRDVDENEYYAPAVAWAAKTGIVKGVGGQMFDPDGTATREQMMTILHRYIHYLRKAAGSGAPLDAYGDSGDVSDWALDSVEWAVAEGILQGSTDSTLLPLNATTREQLASFLVRMIDSYSLA